MKILAIDTSTNVLGIGIVSHEKVIGEYITNIKRNHSTRVLPAIDFLLKDCGLEKDEIDKIVVADGPGSYTGLRIGVTIGKSLAWGLKIPISGVSSLKQMAAAGRYFPGVISPIMDARRENIFTGLYEYKDDELQSIVDDQHVSVDEWIQLLKEKEQPVLFIGTDSLLHREKLSISLAENAHFGPITIDNPRPGELGLLGRNSSENEAHLFKPNYLRLSEAEAKWREKNRNN